MSYEYSSKYKCMCALICSFSSFYNKEAHYTPCLYVQEGFEEGCALWTDNFIGARSGVVMGTGQNCAVAETWHETRDRIEFC